MGPTENKLHPRRYLEMAHYLVTGGCGFIGSHLVSAIERDGHRVTVLDDLSTGNRQNVSPSTKVVVGTITNTSTVNALLYGVDGIFHLAAIASVERSRTEWGRTHAANQPALSTSLTA